MPRSHAILQETTVAPAHAVTARGRSGEPGAVRHGDCPSAVPPGPGGRAAQKKG